MQTFLPFRAFALSAKVLDDKRLGKQRVEAWQIYECLIYGGAWQNHPAVKQWRGYEQALLAYGVAICTEWVGRGFRDIMRERFFDRRQGDIIYPPWLGNSRFHDSHKQRLYQKDPVYYAAFKDAVAEPCCPGCTYYWPTHDRTFDSRTS